MGLYKIMCVKLLKIMNHYRILKIFHSIQRLKKISNFLSICVSSFDIWISWKYASGSVFSFYYLMKWLVHSRYSANICQMDGRTHKWVSGCLYLKETSFFQKEMWAGTKDWIRSETLQYMDYNCSIMSEMLIFKMSWGTMQNINGRKNKAWTGPLYK